MQNNPWHEIISIKYLKLMELRFDMWLFHPECHDGARLQKKSLVLAVQATDTSTPSKKKLPYWYLVIWYKH